MTHTEDPTRYLGNIDARIVLVTLANFGKIETELTTDEDRWLYLFKDPNLSTGLTKIPTFKSVASIERVAGTHPTLREFYATLDSKKITQDELRRYEASVSAANTALAAEHAKGKAEGLAEANEETARQRIRRKRSRREEINDQEIAEDHKLTEGRVREILAED